ncbi:DUF1611 domain-containing protein [Halobacteria archaeon HArc-gm2]|nr:DUF1611 domain-containing protein [Halobacteria archaeon HArc-gm2]
MRVAVLAHESFPDRAKTAVGILRYGDHDVRALLDRDTAGDRVSDHVPDLPDVPIVASLDDAEDDLDALIVGVAPIGGEFDPSWRDDVRRALERGCDVIAGLHDFLADDEEFATLAAEHGAALRDVRRPPDDLTVSEGRASEVDARVIETVGTDCSTGKMTAAFEVRDAARERGIDAAVVPTGQTGVMIAGWGMVVDRVISDFAAGAVEQMVREAADDHDLLVVEGQGAIAHPAYSGVTMSILHGAMPDALVLCHVAGQETVHGYESFEIPDPASYATLYEAMAAPVRQADVLAGMVNTSDLDDGPAHEAVDSFADELTAPATDPVRFGVGDDVLDALL